MEQMVLEHSPEHADMEQMVLEHSPEHADMEQMVLEHHVEQEVQLLRKHLCHRLYIQFIRNILISIFVFLQLSNFLSFFPKHTYFLFLFLFFKKKLIYIYI
jgi:hypothetical protein